MSNIIFSSSTFKTPLLSLDLMVYHDDKSSDAYVWKGGIAMADNESGLLERVEQLERRVAILEKAV